MYKKEGNYEELRISIKITQHFPAVKLTVAQK